MTAPYQIPFSFVTRKVRMTTPSSPTTSILLYGFDGNTSSDMTVSPPSANNSSEATSTTNANDSVFDWLILGAV